MNEVNILAGYPKPTKPRFVGRNMRTINHRLTAVKLLMKSNLMKFII